MVIDLKHTFPKTPLTLLMTPLHNGAKIIHPGLKDLCAKAKFGVRLTHGYIIHQVCMFSPQLK